MWDGKPIAGKCLYLHADDWRDAIQFVRYAKVVRPLAERVILECPRRLTYLLANCAGVDQVVASDVGERPAFDVHAPLASLPALLGTTVESIPADVPYIEVDSRLIHKWRDRLDAHQGLRVGLAWQGGEPNERVDARAIPLSQFAEGDAPASVTFISLQNHDIRPAQVAGDVTTPLVSLGPELERVDVGFDDTAAVIKNLDLVIATDVAIAHLTGALGVPVWVLLSYSPDWRWLLGREDSPWYPSMRLFRQPSPGDWPETLALMRRCLRDLVASRNSA
jgi:hypothetical protein